MCAMESSSLVKDYNPVTPAAFARGYIVYCSFGHPHLVCRPEHIPDDPMLPHPIYAFRSGRVFAEQFLHDLDPWRNSQFIISTLFDYLHITSFGSGYKPVTSQLNEVAEALVDERLVMFELWDIAEHPNVVKQQLQKSDKTRSSDAAGSSAPKRSSGADLASPEKKAPAPSSTSSAPVVTGAGKKADTSKASEPQASEASAKKAPAPKKAPPQSMEECVQRLADARKRLEETGEYQPKYSQSELTELAEKGELNDRFFVRLIFGDVSKAENTSLGFPRPDSKRAPYWATTFDQMENADTDPMLLAALFGIDHKEISPDQEFTLAIIDSHSMPPKAERETFIPTFEKMKDFSKRELKGDLKERKIPQGVIDEVLSEEGAIEFEKTIETYKEKGGNIFDEQDFKEFLEIENNNNQNQSLARFRIMNQFGANQLFSGNGLTKIDKSSDWGSKTKGNYGVVESFTFERDPLEINQLENAVKLIKAPRV